MVVKTIRSTTPPFSFPVSLVDTTTHTGEMMLDIEAEERKIINEFCHLLEKSKQLFNGLRDLPQVPVLAGF